MAIAPHRIGPALHGDVRTVDTRGGRCLDVDVDVPTPGEGATIESLLGGHDGEYRGYGRVFRRRSNPTMGDRHPHDNRQQLISLVNEGTRTLL